MSDGWQAFGTQHGAGTQQSPASQITALCHRCWLAAMAHGSSPKAESLLDFHTVVSQPFPWCWAQGRH
jgi:hypothetical protein